MRFTIVLQYILLFISTALDTSRNKLSMTHLICAGTFGEMTIHDEKEMKGYGLVNTAKQLALAIGIATMAIYIYIYIYIYNYKWQLWNVE